MNEIKRPLPDQLADVRVSGKLLRVLAEMAAAARRSERKT